MWKWDTFKPSKAFTYAQLSSHICILFHFFHYIYFLLLFLRLHLSSFRKCFAFIGGVDVTWKGKFKKKKVWNITIFFFSFLLKPSTVFLYIFMDGYIKYTFDMLMHIRVQYFAVFLKLFILKCPINFSFNLTVKNFEMHF